MAKGLVNESSLNSIGEAINVLNGTEGTYAPSEMGEAIIDAIPTETASGDFIHTTDAAAYPVESVVTTLEPIQEGSGNPSPENIRPIIGYTGVKLTRTGKNLIPNGTNTNNGYVEGKFLKNDNTTYFAADYYISEFFPILSSANYVLSCDGSAPSAPSVCFYDESKTFISGIKFEGHKSTVITTPNNAKYARCSQRTTELGLMQFELGTSGTTIESYTPEKHSITFPQAQSPVYGCEVDWVNGVLRVTKVSVDLGSLSLIVLENGRFYTDSLKDIIKNCNYSTEITSAKCSCYLSTTGRDASLKIINGSLGVDGVGRVYFYDSAKNEKTAEQIKTELTGQQLVYELATPIEIPLTPEVITLLKGDNNIWTDSGTSEIEYKVDLQTYIDELKNNTSVSSESLQSANVNSLSMGDANLTDVDMSESE